MTKDFDKKYLVDLGLPFEISILISMAKNVVVKLFMIKSYLKLDGQ